MLLPLRRIPRIVEYEWNFSSLEKESSASRVKKKQDGLLSGTNLPNSQETINFVWVFFWDQPKPRNVQVA